MAFTLSLASKAPDFSLPGVDGKHYSLASFKTPRCLSLYFPATIARM